MNCFQFSCQTRITRTGLCSPANWENTRKRWFPAGWYLLRSWPCGEPRAVTYCQSQTDAIFLGGDERCAESTQQALISPLPSSLMYKTGQFCMTGHRWSKSLLPAALSPLRAMLRISCRISFSSRIALTGQSKSV